MFNLIRSDDDTFHDIFINADWNLEKIKNYFGDTPTILTNVLMRRSCSVDVVELLLKEGADINCQDDSGYSPLEIALGISNDETVIRVLLESGAEVNKLDRFGSTHLLKYLEREDCSVGTVEVLLDFKAEVNRMNVYGDSPLGTAIRTAKDDAVIRVLVERGAEVNDLKNLHNSPLLVLLRRRKNCSVDIVKLLLAKGADINCVDKCGCSPLPTALKNSRNEAIIQALLEGGAEVDIVCESGETPLLLYLGHRYSDNRCFVGIVKLLLQYKAEVNSMDNYGNSPLTTALSNKRSKTIIQTLLEGGAGVDTLDGSGKSALCIAFRHSSNDVVKLLLDAGSSPDACKYHESALHCATDVSYSGLREDILKRLLETNIDVNSVNRYGQSVLCYALRKGAKAHDIQLLLDAGASLSTCVLHASPLICATDGRTGALLREDVVQLLLDNRAGVGDKGLEILQSVLGYGKYETGAIQLLLGLPGMDAHVVANESDKSLLHLAVQNPNCRPDAVKLLINRKAQVHSENQIGETPLHCAVRNESCDPRIINLLLQNGSLANTKNKSHETPLTLAVEQKCNANILKELLIAGARIGEAKFCHCSEEFKLLEFLAREYEMSRYPLTDSYNMLVKFFFLQYPECNIGDIQRTSRIMYGNECLIEYGIRKLEIFVSECLSELKKMDLMQVGPGCTFRKFIAGNPEEDDLSQILEYMMEKTYFPGYLGKFPGYLDIIFVSFPLFSDIIFARVKKLMIEQKYCPSSLCVRGVNLDSVILRKISTFLSDDDFLRFILAFYKYCPSSLCVRGVNLDPVILRKISTFLSDDDFLRFILAFYKPCKLNSSGETLLGKRNPEPSIKPYKYLKPHH